MRRALASSSQTQRQIVLPMSRAAEIAYKNIRLRLGRSLLVTSSILLALGFLASILFSQAIQQGMRQWMQQSAQSQQFAQLRERRAELQARLPALAVAVRTAAPAAGGKKKASAAGSADAARWAELGRRAGSLPLPAEQMGVAAASNERAQAAVQAWALAAGQLAAVREQLGAPDQLAALMKSRGVPATAAEVASDRIQTRWLVALALLVAFIGILNAMLMSVTERFREIGTMKCLGALDGFIVRLFLLESLFQGVVGTVLGIVAGGGLTLLVLGLSYGRFAWINFPMRSLLLCAGICLAVGLVLTVCGAIYPAWQAARMQPIAAMRVEA